MEIENEGYKNELAKINKCILNNYNSYVRKLGTIDNVERQLIGFSFLVIEFLKCMP